MALTTFVAGSVLTAAQLNDSFAAVGGARAVVPTSVAVTGVGSSGTVGTNGTITYATAASLSINGCFSATFRNYLVVHDFDTSAAAPDIYIRLRVGGTDNTTASSYVTQRLRADATTVAGARVTTDNWTAAQAASTATNGTSMFFYRPFLADTTAFSSHAVDSASSAIVAVYSATHNQNTSYDGFTIYPQSGTITGTITIYGLFG